MLQTTRKELAARLQVPVTQEYQPMINPECNPFVPPPVHVVAVSAIAGELSWGVRVEFRWAVPLDEAALRAAVAADLARHRYENRRRWPATGVYQFRPARWPTEQRVDAHVIAAVLASPAWQAFYDQGGRVRRGPRHGPGVLVAAPRPMDATGFTSVRWHAHGGTVEVLASELAGAGATELAGRT